MSQIDQFLLRAHEMGATDLHIVSDAPPTVRINGRMSAIESEEKIGTKKAERLCLDILTDAMKKDLKANGELHFSYEIPERAKFRANVYFEGGTVAGHFRRLTFRVPALEEIGLPKSAFELTRAVDGLIVVSGPARSGRTTTIASMLQRIIEQRSPTLMTVENPVEFELKGKGSIVNHREIGRDVIDMKSAIESISKQDVDLCFLGDVVGSDGFRSATQVAMMGIQTYVSCYANSAVETLDNFVSVFSSEEKSWITRTLSNSLKAVINQRVLPGIAGRPVVAFELLLPTPEVRKAIREENFDGIAEALKKDQAKTGMITLNQSLMNLLVKRKVELKNAFEASPDPDELDQLLKKAGL